MCTLQFLGLAISKASTCDNDSEMKRVEKKLANFKSSIVEKCQSSKIWCDWDYLLVHYSYINLLFIPSRNRMLNKCIWLNVWCCYILNFIMNFADLELWTIINDIEDCSPYFPLGIGSPSPYISPTKKK